jgi:hypothetical protein
MPELPDLDLDPTLSTVELARCEYTSRCRARTCRARATVIARKLDAPGRFIRKIELCDRHAEVVAKRERAKRLEIVNCRTGWK